MTRQQPSEIAAQIDSLREEGAVPDVSDYWDDDARHVGYKCPDCGAVMETQITPGGEQRGHEPAAVQEMPCFECDDWQPFERMDVDVDAEGGPADAS